MEDIINLKGHLLSAHPRRSDNPLKKGVLLVIDQDLTGSVGLQINKPMTNHPNLVTVMQSLGINYSEDIPIYFGGTENANRIIVVHSNDWSSPGTTKITEDISISNDVSVLTAIAANQGPSKFRAVAGYTRWLPGHLESEIDGELPYNDISRSWIHIPASSELIFGSSGIDQWHYVLEQSAKAQIATWF
jgi:putative AlgH/UPF0301 family transcriptional regulator